MQRRIFIPVVFLTFLTFSLAGNQIVSKSDSLRRLIGKTGSKAEIFNQLAELWIDSLPEESAAFADSALLAAGSTEEKARAYYNKGEAFYFLNENEKALEAYTQALNLFMESGMLKQQANCFITIGIIHDTWGNYDEALDYYHKSYIIYRNTDNKEGMSYALNNIGIIYNVRGQYRQGYVYFMKSLNIEEELGNESGIAYSLNNIGLIHRKLGNIDKAIECYRRSLEIKKKLGDKEGVALTSGNLGHIYEERNMFDLAKEYYQNSLDIFREINQLEGVGVMLSNLGSICMNSGNYSEALNYYNEALSARRQIGNRAGLAGTYNKIGNVFLKLKKPALAKLYLDSCTTLAEELQLAEHSRDVYLSWSDYFLAQNNPGRSLEFYKLYSAMKDSLLNDQNARQVSEIQTLYETGKKEQDIKNKEAQIRMLDKEKEIQALQLERNRIYGIFLIVVLLLLILLAIILYNRYRARKKMNRVLEGKNTQLEELNATKTKFFSIISHDLKNPFGMLCSVSDMLAESYNELSDEDRKNIINTIKKSAGMSRELLENLLQWAMTQTGKIPCSPVKLELTKLVENIMELYAAVASNKNISLKKEFNGELFVHADTNMISAILQNLISNAIKFTPENGSVTISLSEENNRAVIKVSDTGIGMSPGDLPKLFRIDTDHRKIGTSKEKGTGLGLILCREFAGLNRGSIFAESEAGKGSSFTVILPLYKT